ncbi:MAG: putative cytochrome c protein [Enterovirga sp.]|nr:putative cytochrome c protein [Enterovirga sp.]
MGKRNSLAARASLAAVAAAIAGMLVCTAHAEPKKPARSEDGKYFDKDDVPTYNISEGGKVDWYTYSGYRRYHAECHVCHGPDVMGSRYAPALVDSAKNLTYQQFTEIVVQGRQNVTASAHNVMPSFGTNMNVMCYLDDIYVYLRARADGALGRVRPNEREQKPEAAVAAEKSCIGG